MTSGDPKEAMPGFVAEKLVEAKELLGTYPKIRGSDELRKAHRRLDRPSLRPRHGDRLRARGAAPSTARAKACSSRRLPAVGRKSFVGRPVMLLPNPFYQAYLGGTYGTGCEPVYLNATAETGHLPDLDALAREPDILRRTAAFFLCSPANPQGSVAGADYIAKALALAREYDFMLFLDECYSEIYTAPRPRPAVCRSRPRRPSASRT